ncbi:MAG: MarR family transcriptional regulator [Micropruina sp.]
MADETPWLTTEQRSDWIALAALLMSLPAVIDTQLKRDAGLNFFEYTILAGLSEVANGSIRMSVLAHFASGSLSRLSHAVSRLERQGFVTRSVCQADPRAVEASITPAGLAKIQASAPAHVREVRRAVVDALTEEEFALLGGLARKVMRAACPAALSAMDADELMRTISPA